VLYASHSRSRSRVWFRRVVHVPNPNMQIFAIRLLSGQTLFELPSMTSSPIPGRRRFMLACLSLSCLVPLTASAAIPPVAADSTRKRVFAHYMVAWPRGGPQATVASYQAEFRDVHTRGIDGFALNCGGWDARSLSEFPLVEVACLRFKHVSRATRRSNSSAREADVFDASVARLKDQTPTDS
jgi:hypothetical protein